MWLTYTALQANWEVRLSTSRGVPYFYNTDTHESIWEAPPGLTQEQIAALPGARQHLLEGGRPAQVRASHLLVKHRGSRRPSSWKEVSGPLPPYVLTHSTSCVLAKANITRSKEEAIEILNGYAAEINGSPDKFAELASKHSDCSSHSNGGDLGFFKPVSHMRL